MARRSSSKVSPWFAPPIRKSLLVQALLMAFAHAGAATAAPAAAPPGQSAAVVVADASAFMAAGGGQELYLETTLNGAERGLVHFDLRDGALWASTETLRQLGFRLPVDTPSPIRLDRLNGLQADYSAARQTATLTAPIGFLDLPTQMLGAPLDRYPVANATPGMLLNYTLYGTQGEGGASSGSAYTELRAFNNHGVLSSTQLSQVARADNGWAASSVRLDTSWTTSFPDSLLSVRLGDTLTAATDWSRPTRLGGVQIGTNFALQPYRVTTPLPQFLGTAALPSQVELYVNGMKQYSGQVPAGPFQLNTVPGINGAGNAQVVLTDALGRQTALNFALYNTPNLLQAGLTDWSAELGVVRQDYGLTSFSYGSDPVASGTWRRGVTDGFTAEAHAETTRNLVNAGVGGAWLVGQSGGIVSGSAAHSTGEGISGSQFGLGYNWSNSAFYAAVNGTRAERGYRDVATLYGAPPPQLSASAQVGYNTPLLGSFGLGYVQLRDEIQTNRYGSFSWSRSLGRNVSLSLNFNQNLDQSRDRNIFFTLNVALDNLFMGASAQRSGERNIFSANASKAIPLEGGWGWRAQTQQGDDLHSTQGEIDYLGRYGQLQAGVSTFGGSTTGFASATGSVVLMDGHVKAARNIYNGFAVVSTDGVPNVPVKLENNVIGVTDKDGLLLVAPLNPYQNNKLSIDPMDLPPDVRVAQVDANATPSDRAGTVVRFGITPIRAASIALVDAQGQPVAMGSRARLAGSTSAPVTVGFDGAVYFDALGARNMLAVDTPAGPCHAAFDFPTQRGIAQIGPLQCIPGVAP